MTIINTSTKNICKIVVISQFDKKMTSRQGAKKHKESKALRPGPKNLATLRGTLFQDNPTQWW